MASRILKSPVAVISFVDDCHQFFKSAVGLGEPWASDRSTPLTHSFCKHVVSTGETLVINDAANEPLVKDDLASNDPAFAAYAGVPVKSAAGQTLGCFCVIDIHPRRWTQDELSLLTELAQSCMTEITLREQYAEHQEFLAQFQSWMSRMPVGAFMCDVNQRISGWNPAAEKIFGHTREEAEGSTPQDLIFKPEDRADAEKRFVEMALAGEPSRSITRCVAKDGSTVICSWTITTLLEPDGTFGGAIAMVEDCTSQMRIDRDRAIMETQMRESQERFRQLADSIREVFWMTNIDRTRILYVSPAYERIWGKSCDSLYQSALSWTESIHPDDRERILKAAKEKQLLGQYDEEFRILRPDGSVRWIRDQAFPVNDGAGHVTGIAGVSEDISQRKRLEDQLRQSQKMDAIGQLAGGVAHDFNNILTVIHGNASLLLETQVKNPDVAGFAQQIVLAAERAAALTRQMLMLSRKQTPHLVNVNLGGLVARMSSMFHRIIGEDIAFHPANADSGAFIRADAGMIEQVLLNLVVNARDAMPQGGQLQITTHVEQVESTSIAQNADAKPGPHVVLSVTDSGVGISAEDLPRIFEPFFTTKEAGKGTGLGLATVYGIVKQHHGWISVISAPGKGTIFKIFFPAAEGPVPTASTTTRTEPMPKGNETLLVVEDEKAVRHLVTTTLERCGYTVLTAATGRDAMKVWEKSKDRIHLLLTDVIMPDGMSGTELGDRLALENPDLKIIYTSGHGQKAFGNPDTELDSRSFILKPYSLHQIAALIRLRLDESKSEMLHR